MVKLKWFQLNKEQRSQVSKFYDDAVKQKQVVLNKLYCLVNVRTGNVAFRKDF